jgi:type IV fimbrial biogenesis protein FimT
MKRSRGLSLVEMMIAVAALAFIASLALPAARGTLQRQRLKTAAETLAADLMEARYEAARSGQAVHVLAQPGAQWCWAVSLQPACDCSQPMACQLKTVRAREFPGVSLSRTQPASFLPTGVLQSGAVATHLQSTQGERLQVEVSALGRSRVCTPAGSVPGYSGC